MKRSALLYGFAWFLVIAYLLDRQSLAAARARAGVSSSDHPAGMPAIGTVRIDAAGRTIGPSDNPYDYQPRS